MSQPILTIVAGCNGSGKSTFSKDIVSANLTPFDYDKRFRGNYASLIDSEFREEMAKNQTTQEFESSIHGAFSSGDDFCYETNFDSHPIFWAEIAKQHGYLVHLRFFCLDTLELANERVKSRHRMNGHFIPENIVFYKWKAGYKNLNIHYSFFDDIILFDNSSSDEPLRALFSLQKEKEGFNVYQYNLLPEYAQRRFPDICRLINLK